MERVWFYCYMCTPTFTDFYTYVTEIEELERIAFSNLVMEIERCDCRYCEIILRKSICLVPSPRQHFIWYRYQNEDYSKMYGRFRIIDADLIICNTGQSVNLDYLLTHIKEGTVLWFNSTHEYFQTVLDVINNTTSFRVVRIQNFDNSYIIQKPTLTKPAAKNINNNL